MISASDYFRSTRKPMGANTLQPPMNSGVPGTANQQPIKQPANHRGVSKVGLSSQSLYGPPTSSQAARDYGQQQQRPAQVNYGKPTVSNPYGQSPELDRWTGMGVDASDYHNLKAGSVSPKEWQDIKSKAVQSNLDRFNNISPQRQSQLDADVTMDREIAAKDAADAQRSLGFTGATIGDYTDRTNRATDYYGQRRASADAMNEHLDAGGGLQYRQGSTGFGLPEQSAQAAADYRRMYASDRARQEDINAQQQAGFDAYQTNKLERDNAQREQGIDPERARRDVSKLTGQYTAIVRSGRGGSFTDFVQGEINAGRLAPDSDAISIIEKNYGHDFDMSTAGDSMGKPNDLQYVREDYADRKRMLQQRKDEGLVRRQQVAAQLADDRTRRADLIGQGMSPYTARVAIGQQNDARAAYNQQRLLGQDKLEAELAANQLEVYQRDIADQRKYLDKESQRAYDLANPKQTAAPKQSAKSTQPGTPPKSEAKQPTKSGLSTRAQDSLDALNHPDKKFKKNDPGSLAQASRHFDEQGLSPDEHAQALGQLYDTDFSDSEAATKTLSNLSAFAEKLAKEQGSWRDPNGAQRKRADATIMDHLPAIRAIGHAAGLTPEQVAEHVYPEHMRWGGIHDPFLPERKKLLVDALTQNAGGANDE